MKQFTFNSLGVNCYVLWDEETREAVIIDSAMQFPEEQKAFARFIEEEQLKPVLALQTHMHFDHIFGVPFVHKTYGLTPRSHRADFKLYADLPLWLSQFGMRPQGNYPTLQEDLQDEARLHVGNIEIKVLHTPGHTPGGVCFYLPEQQMVFTGDTLFAGSLGRSDLPGGDFEQEIQSIRQRLFTLPAETLVFPGHGPSSTIQREIATNPYF